MNRQKLYVTALAGTLAAAIAACSSTPPHNPALDQARVRFNAAEADPQVATLAPEELKRAGDSRPQPVLTGAAMNSMRIFAVLLIVGGTLGLAYGGFTYTKDTHEANIGALHLQLNEKEHVNIPLWAGVGAIVGDVLLLLGSARRS